MIIDQVPYTISVVPCLPKEGALHLDKEVELNLIISTLLGCWSLIAKPPGVHKADRYSPESVSIRVPSWVLVSLSCFPPCLFPNGLSMSQVDTFPQSMHALHFYPLSHISEEEQEIKLYTKA